MMVEVSVTTRPSSPAPRKKLDADPVPGSVAAATGAPVLGSYGRVAAW